LPRRKLDALGVDADVDCVKLSANNKANVCAAVQRAYNRARQQIGSSDQLMTSAAAVDAEQLTTDTAAAAADVPVAIDAGSTD